MAQRAGAGARRSWCASSASCCASTRQDLGTLVSIEAGKIRSEGLGEVQEMIDICDLAVGLSRQLFGLTIASERPGHRMMEQWHPLGVVGVISAFNFPVAVWSWNAALALVCGDAVVWKPSEKTLLTALACQALLAEAARRVGAPEAISSVVLGGAEVGEALVDDPRVALLSATGSTRMGRAVAPRVAARFGRLLLELGGNNAAIVAPSADLDLTVRGIVFSAAGTAGQRCTSLRRVIAHYVDRRRAGRAASRPPTSHCRSARRWPRARWSARSSTQAAYDGYVDALEKAQRQWRRADRRRRRGCWPTRLSDAYYVQPAIVRMPTQTEIVRAETFAPILYVLTYDDFDEAIALHNDVPQGLVVVDLHHRRPRGRALHVRRRLGLRHRERQHRPIGAEIGGAFGGEKETGGGRESGSDAWKAYMRRTTNTVNYSTDLPLAQGVEFG